MDPSVPLDRPRPSVVAYSPKASAAGSESIQSRSQAHRIFLSLLVPPNNIALCSRARPLRTTLDLPPSGDASSPPSSTTITTFNHDLLLSIPWLLPEGALCVDVVQCVLELNILSKLIRRPPIQRASRPSSRLGPPIQPMTKKETRVVAWDSAQHSCHASRPEIVVNGAVVSPI